uniref:Uncharacterized protein n=1 Tax=Arion vulgaris TaxID=1028688 RepID=A0A0B6Y021_9EUPU
MGCSGSTGTKVISLNDDKKPQGKSNEDEDADKDIENTPQQPSEPVDPEHVTEASPGTDHDEGI